MVNFFQEFANDPSDAFVRSVLSSIGLKHVRNRALGEYKDLTKSAFAEFMNVQILKRLDIRSPEPTSAAVGPLRVAALDAQPTEVAISPAAPRIETTPKELEIFDYARRRLAFLLEDVDLFDKVAFVRFRDYAGKFAVFYRQERKGRIFDFEQARGDGCGAFFFPHSESRIVPKTLAELDELLVAGFRQRVDELG